MAGKRTTIKDVAAKAGVGISIVSYVLNNTPGKTVSAATRQRIFDAVEELQYTPNAIARGMRIKKTMTIGLVSYWNVNDLVFIEILEGVSRIADENGYNILYCSLKSDKHAFSYKELFRRQQIDGIILVSPPEHNTDYNEMEHIDAIKKDKIPAVIINGCTKDDSLSYIYFDYYQTAYKAAEYLIGLGHRKIGYLLPCEKDMRHVQAQERVRGFKDALRDHGIEIANGFIYHPEDVECLCDRIMKGEGPTGLVTNKSDYGYIFLKHANNRGIRVPEQISVIAANTESYANYLFPALTTIHLPMKEIGRKAAEVLMDIMDGRMSQVKLKLPNRVEERESCGRI
ncbi:MAG: LacI family DNA-binding transcriptional regulator [Clostridiaceae bacterium]